MKKKIAKIVVLALGLALIVYGALRSYDFLSLTVPADKAWWAYAGLAATEFGLVGWLIAFLWDEGSSTQNAISLVMLIVDFMGSIALSTADMFLVSGQNGLVANLDTTTMGYILIGLAGLVAINVGAGLAHVAADPGASRARAEREAFSEIEDEALKFIKEHAKELAGELGMAVADDWRDRTVASYRNRLGGVGQKQAALPAPANSTVPEMRAFASTAADTIASTKQETASTEPGNPTPRRRKI